MSLDIKTNYSLRDYNTFAIDATADEFVEIHSVADLRSAIKTYDKQRVLVLGGGSNLLFDQQRIRQPVFWINLKGIRVEQEDELRVVVRAMAGENWHDFVMWCLQHDYGGLENLSLIPGSVGAAPVQNIGAYGVEIKDSLYDVEAVSLVDGQRRSFSPEQCRFAYRDSIFKHSDGSHWIIVSVAFSLSRQQHELHLDYGAIRQTLQDAQIEHPSISDISHAVVAIRQQKLPDPKQLPNAGSFFKNPVIDARVFRELQAAHADMPGYELPDGKPEGLSSSINPAAFASLSMISISGNWTVIVRRLYSTSITRPRNTLTTRKS